MKILDSLFGKKCERCHSSRIGSNKDYCDDCLVIIESEKEVKLKCPVCETEMAKDIWRSVITDKCPTCEGVWTSKDELQKIKDTVADDHSSDGMGAGIAVGAILDPF